MSTETEYNEKYKVFGVQQYPGIKKQMVDIFDVEEDARMEINHAMLCHRLAGHTGIIVTDLHHGTQWIVQRAITGRLTIRDKQTGERIL